MSERMWERVLALKEQGLNAQQIAEQLGSTIGSVRVILSNRQKKEQRLAIYIKPKVERLLLQAARRRGMAVDDLASRLLSAVAEDNIFDAVLDDAA